MAMQHLKEGLDPTALDCITLSELLQMIRNAKPYPKQGFIIFADDAPDVVTNPELEYFLWMKTVADVPNKEVYYYNGSSWELLPLIDGEYLGDHTVPLDKIKMTGSSAFDILQVDATNSFLQFVAVVDAILNNSIPPIKLLAPDALYKYALVCLAGVKSFKLIDDIVAQDITDNVLPVAKLIRGGADTLKLFLSTKADGSAIEWANIDVANLAAAAGAAGQSIRRNAGNDAWEYFAPTSGGKPYFIVVPPTVYSGSTVAWATYNAAGAVPVGTCAAILRITATVADAEDQPAGCVVKGRDVVTSGIEVVLLDLVSSGEDPVRQVVQVIVPVSAARTFDYKVDGPAAEIKLIGYYA